MLKMGAMAIGPIVGLGVTFSKLAGDINDGSERIKFSTTAYQAWGNVAQKAGIGIADVEAAVSKLNRTVEDAKGGSKIAKDNLNELGLLASSFAGKNNEQRMLMMSDALRSIGDEAQRSAVGFSVLGKGADKLLPILTSGDLKGNLKIESGKAIDPETIKSLQAFDDLMEDIKNSALQLGATITATFSKELNQVGKDIESAILSGTAWVKANKEMISSIAGVALEFGKWYLASALVLKAGGLIIPIVLKMNNVLGSLGLGFKAAETALKAFSASNTLAMLSLNKIGPAFKAALVAVRGFFTGFMAAGGAYVLLAAVIVAALGSIYLSVTENNKAIADSVEQLNMLEQARANLQGQSIDLDISGEQGLSRTKESALKETEQLVKQLAIQGNSEAEINDILLQRARIFTTLNKDMPKFNADNSAYDSLQYEGLKKDREMLAQAALEYTSKVGESSKKFKEEAQKMGKASADSLITKMIADGSSAQQILGGVKTRLSEISKELANEGANKTALVSELLKLTDIDVGGESALRPFFDQAVEMAKALENSGKSLLDKAKEFLAEKKKIDESFKARQEAKAIAENTKGLVNSAETQSGSEVTTKLTDLIKTLQEKEAVSAAKVGSANTTEELTAASEAFTQTVKDLTQAEADLAAVQSAVNDAQNKAVQTQKQFEDSQAQRLTQEDVKTTQQDFAKQIDFSPEKAFNEAKTKVDDLLAEHTMLVEQARNALSQATSNPTKDNQALAEDAVSQVNSQEDMLSLWTDLMDNAKTKWDDLMNVAAEETIAVNDKVAEQMSVRGTFNSSAVQGLQGSNSSIDRTARATEQTAANTEKILRNQKGGMTFA